MVDSLWAYLDDRPVARLDRDAAGLSLHYDSAGAASLSLRLPAREQPYADAECRAFFSNLLPEGGWREALCRQLGISPDDDFALLEAIGAECAGAVALRPEPEWTPEEGRYVETTEATLSKWMKNPAARPHLKSTPGLRLSLAGAQDKLLIHLDGGTPYLCEGGAPSTVILKPDIHDPLSQIELSGLNELFAMKLAARAGIPAARAFWFASGFAVQRFDRVRQDDRWRRLHQEDFAQVLGLPARAKYSVTWPDCFELASRHATTPARTRVALADRLLFNLLLGNNDAHGKNFALLRDAGGDVELSPAYDLLCTQLYAPLSRTFAMPIGGAESIDQLERDDWSTFAKQVGVGLPFLRERASQTIENVRAALDGLREAVEEARPALRHDVYPLRRRDKLFGGMNRVIDANRKAIVRSLISARG